MAQHSPTHSHEHGHNAEAGLADMLDMDAAVAGSYLREATDWAAELTPAPREIADIGAGTGTGSLALAQRFGDAEVIAIDASSLMLDRIREAAREQGVADRMRTVQADLDEGWPAIGNVDLVWASSSLHHVTDPDQVLRDIYSALNPGGLLMAIEMDDLPFFLPGDGGLESRLHEIAAREHWNAHPDWTAHLKRAGFEIAGQRGFSTEASPAPPGASRYAHRFLTNFRTGFADKLPAEDLDTLDRLLSDDHPESVLTRPDLTVRNTRTAWAALRA